MQDCVKVTRNRLWNCKNDWQGDDVKLLCVCSAGLLRSPTTARWLMRTFENVNARAVGTSHDHALIPLDLVHLTWADVILCMDHENFEDVEEALEESNLDREVHCLNVPDDFGFGDPQLTNHIETKMSKLIN